MAVSQGIDSEDIWRRVGLEELRRALVQVTDQMKGLEQVLRVLPPCNACARGQLLEQIQTAGSHLSRELVGLTVLAGSLKGAVTTAEQAQAELAANAPDPCRCSSGQCTCHE